MRNSWNKPDWHYSIMEHVKAAVFHKNSKGHNISLVLLSNFWKTQLVHISKHSFESALHDLQLEAGHRLHRAAVWAVLQGWERPQQEEHPGQQGPLLPLLHPSLWTRVTHAPPPRAVCERPCFEMLSKVSVLSQASSSGCGVHEGPAGQS